MVATWEGAVTGFPYNEKDEEVLVKISFPAEGEVICMPQFKRSCFQARSLKSTPTPPMGGGPKEFGGTKAFKPLVQRDVIVSFGPAKSLFCPSNSIIPEAVFIIMSKL